MTSYAIVRHIVMSAVFASLGSVATLGHAVTGEAFTQSVWFDVLFDERGLVKELLPVDKDSQPQAFWDQMVKRSSKSRIEPQQLDGHAVSFRTGMEVSLEVRKEADGKGSVAMKGSRFLPLPIQRYAASYPKDANRTAGWNGEVTAVCTVGREGKCVMIDVQAPAGMPESVRRFAKVSLEGWRFKPQELDGQAIEGKYTTTFIMETGNEMPVDFRDMRRL